MKHYFSLGFILSALLATLSCKKETNTENRRLIWEADSNYAYYGCENPKQIKDKNECGIVEGENGLPTSFLFRFKVGTAAQHIRSFEDSIRKYHKTLTIDSCTCDPLLRKYGNFPIRSIYKSGDPENIVIISGGGSAAGNTIIELKDSTIKEFSPNYRVFGEKTPLEGKPKEKLFAQKEGGNKLKIGVLDTGYDANFGSLKPHSLQPCTGKTDFNFVATAGQFDDDPTKHGTIVTTLLMDAIPQEKRNDVEVIPIKVLDKDGYTTLFNFICALSSLKGKKVDIINASLGFYAPNDSIPSGLIKTYIEETEAWFFAAAGNKNTYIDGLDNTSSRDLEIRKLKFYPASIKDIKNMIVVTSAFSDSRNNFDICPNQNYSNTLVDVSVEASKNCYIRYDNPYFTLQGTGSSFATPVVAGKAASAILSAPSTNKNALLNSINMGNISGMPAASKTRLSKIVKRP